MAGAAEMQPLEINAGAWYLRALRADERIDDRPALTGLGETRGDYVERSLADWASDTGYSWAVCESTTGEVLAEVRINPRSGALYTRARAGSDDAATVAAEAVRRFAAAFGTSKQTGRTPKLAPPLSLTGRPG